jgi:DNA-binding GntR family transcriptional regulator
MGPKTTKPKHESLRPRAGAATLGQIVHDELRELLVAGVLSPGEKVSLRTMAARLGVSMQPVREAVARLVADRALEVLPNRAVRVPLLTLAQFRELTAIRLAIEGFAAERAARCRSTRELAAMRAHETAFRRAGRGRSPDLPQAVVSNKAFHFAVYRAARLPELLPIIEGLWLRIGPVLNLDLRSNVSRVRVGRAADHHGHLLEAIARGDARAARSALAADVRGAARHIESQGVLPGTAKDNEERKTDGP